jgi:hypothetical protein
MVKIKMLAATAYFALYSQQARARQRGGTSFRQ